MEETVKRAYRSRLRQTQARATRWAIIQAAARLFCEQGYSTTSIDGIATAAGVSRATVFTSVGGKPLLLKLAYDVAIVGDDEPVALPERPRSRAIRAEPHPRRYLALYAELVTEMGARLAPISEAFRGAAAADRQVRAMWQEEQQQRARGAANVAQDVMRRGPLREGLDVSTAADLVWVLNDPGLYFALVHQSGWAPARFQAWLADTLQRQLLPD